MNGIRYASFAQWPEGTCSGERIPDRSEDIHDTAEQASAICTFLQRNGFGGDRKIFPLRTWVQPVPWYEPDQTEIIHTSRPMTTNPPKLPERLKYNHGHSFQSEDGKFSGAIYDTGMVGLDAGREFAAQIVARWNCHDALKSALEEVQFEDGLCGRGTMKMVKEALALAAERSGE